MRVAQATVCVLGECLPPELAIESDLDWDGVPNGTGDACDADLRHLVPRTMTLLRLPWSTDRGGRLYLSSIRLDTPARVSCWNG